MAYGRKVKSGEAAIRHVVGFDPMTCTWVRIITRSHCSGKTVYQNVRNRMRYVRAVEVLPPIYYPDLGIGYRAFPYRRADEKFFRAFVVSAIIEREK